MVLKPVDRRAFLRLAGLAAGSALLAPLLKACQGLGLTQSPEPSPSPSIPEPAPAAPPAAALDSPLPVSTATQGTDLAQLAFVRTRDRAAGVRQALDLLGLDPVRDRDVLLKPNFNSADPAPASTHPETIRALVGWLQEMGATRITVADRSGMGHSRDVMQRLGLFAMAQELGFEMLSFEDLADVDWALVRPAGSHWAAGFPFARPVLEAGALVSTCCLKPHRYGGHFTLSLKNTVGMVARSYGGRNYMTELHDSPDQRLMIAEANTACTPALVVLDGVEAFIDRGPDVGTKVWGEVILAGSDRVAVDAVGLALLRLLGYRGVAAQGPVFGQEQIRRAVELGLGVTGPEQIRLQTADEASRAYADQVLQELLASG
ncbi:MAG: DUF362 domain-containing protein [Anaerolineales bacterium]|nr:DUF362 domain-containing protein [Anaerolineales bacterium]